MAYKHLKMEELEAFDEGYVVRQMNQMINEAAKDCFDRFNDTTARKIILEIVMIPKATQNGVVKDIEVSMDIKGKKPGFRTEKITCRVGNNGALAYNTNSPDDFDQTTIFDKDDPT